MDDGCNSFGSNRPEPVQPDPMRPEEMRRLAAKYEPIIGLDWPDTREPIRAIEPKR